MFKHETTAPRTNNSSAVQNTIGFKTKSQVSSRNKLHKVTQLDEEPIVSNMYLETLCKAFKEFVQDEARDKYLSEKRFLEKIEAVRLLFPEERKNLKHFVNL